MSRIKDQQGQTLTEFALTLPLLLLILFAIFQFGFLFYSYISIQQAAREGARIAAVGADDTRITTRIQNASAVDPAKLTIAITPATRISGDEVTVTVSIPSAQLLAMPFVASYLPAKIEAKAAMRMERDFP